MFSAGPIHEFGSAVPEVSPDAWIAPSAVIIGNVSIGSESSIWFGCVLRGDVNSIHIGARVNVQDGTIVHVSGQRGGTTIGDDVSIGHMALIHACTLEPGSFVGMSATVMDEAVVETGGIVAAGALVTPGKRVKSGEVWAGRPAKFMRLLTGEDREMIRRTKENYVRLGRQYLAEWSR